MRSNQVVRSVALAAATALFWLGATAAPARAAAGQGKVAHLAGVIAPGRAPVAKRLAVAYQSLDSGLNRVLGSVDPLAAAEVDGFRVRDGRLQVHILTSEGRVEALEEWLAAEGARLISSAGDLIQAHVSPDLLARLATRPEVVAVRRPRYAWEPEPPPHARPAAAASAAGNYTTEGLAAMNAQAWQTAGFTGTGVKVGVIDQGFGGYEGLESNELPPASRVHFQAFGSSTLDASQFHGTACAEIVYDLVPGADMYLGLVQTEVDIANAVTWMQGNGVKVISMSLGWLSWGPGDGTGTVANAINAFVSAGGFWANSAGNSRLAHWQGSWHDDNGNGYLDYAAGSEINYITADGSNAATIPSGTKIVASLIWNQWNAPASDVDFFLYKDKGDGNPQEVAKSDETQNGTAGQLPIEEFVYTTDEDAAYGFAVRLSSGPSNVDIEYFNRLDANPLLFNVQEGSLTPPCDTPSAVAVAALDAGAPYNLESYSSKGPTNGPGGSLAGGSVKPDIAGYAVVSGQSYGPRSAGGFSGTSAACPHVAGAAALVWSAYPSYTTAQVRSLLESRALDMGPAGKDIDYGYGRLYLGDPPTASCDPPATPAGLAPSAGSVASGSSYTISWSAAANATGYELQEDTNAAFSNAITLNSATTSVSRSHTVAANTTYYYRVRATRTCTSSTSSSGYSSTVSVTVTAPQCDPPATPAGLGVSPATVTSGASYTISWSAAANATGYELQEDTNAAFSNAITLIAATTSVNRSRTVAADTTYYYRVRATRTCGASSAASGYSSTATVAITAGGPTSTTLWVPVATRAAGANASQWRTDLGLFNRSAAAASCELRLYTSSVKTYSVTVPASGHVILRDLLGASYLAASGSAALEVRADQRIGVNSRTYNQNANGTFGQSYPSYASSDGLSANESAYLSMLTENAAYRSNIGLVNTGPVPATVTVTLYSGATGAALASYNVSLSPGQWKQENRPFNSKAGQSNLDAGYAKITVTSGSGVFAVASVIDNNPNSNDPTTIEMEK